jgi:hypothetical protein
MTEQHSSNHQRLTEMVNRFLAWPLPQSVCADLCATDSSYKFPRNGTNLLNVYEAASMLEHVTAPMLAEIERLRAALRQTARTLDYVAHESPIDRDALKALSQVCLKDAGPADETREGTA